MRTLNLLKVKIKGVRGRQPLDCHRWMYDDTTFSNDEMLEHAHVLIKDEDHHEVPNEVSEVLIIIT